MRASLAGISLDAWLAAAVGIGTLALLVATLDKPVITWDEGATIEREEVVRKWFSLLVSPSSPVPRAELFSKQRLQQFWPFAREEPDGHPPFYAIIGNIGWLVSRAWLPPLQAHRFGPAVLFSFTTAVMYAFIARRWGPLAGLAAAGSWLLMPRVYAHAHLASYDVPLACLWFLAVVAFCKAQEGWLVSRRAGHSWSLVCAVLLALAAATKFTGWLIPLPLLAWSVIVGLIQPGRGQGSGLKRLIPPALCALPLAFAVPEVVSLTRQVARIDDSLEPVSPENAQQRAAVVARLFREMESSRWPVVALFLPALVWAGIWFVRRRRVALGSTLAAGSLPETWTAAVVLSPPVTLALVPTWWHDPLRGLAIFLWSNLTRQRTTWIPTEFFGTTYEFALPWYNTIAWVGLTVPPGILLLILAGVVSAAIGWPSVADSRSSIEDRQTNSGRDRSSPGDRSTPGAPGLDPRPLAWLLLLNGATLLVIRALPGAPGHDGERQLLGSFPFLACFAGIGSAALRRLLSARITPFSAAWAARGIVATALLWAATGVWHYRAAPLSYYTELVGGLRGAARLGLEPTYYWDALDEETIDWLNANTHPGEKVLFSSHFKGLEYLKRWDRLRVGTLPSEPGRWRWYVLQNRPGLFVAKPHGEDRWLAQRGRHARPPHALDGVPLIWVFPFEDYERAIREGRGSEATAIER